MHVTNSAAVVVWLEANAETLLRPAPLARAARRVFDAFGHEPHARDAESRKEPTR